MICNEINFEIYYISAHACHCFRLPLFRFTGYLVSLCASKQYLHHYNFHVLIAGEKSPHIIITFQEYFGYTLTFVLPCAFYNHLVKFPFIRDLSCFQAKEEFRICDVVLVYSELPFELQRGPTDTVSE